MGCCGQKRAHLQNHPIGAKTAVAAHLEAAKRAATAAEAQAQKNATPAQVSLRYLKISPISIRGPVSGRQYEFSSAQPVQNVEARDAEAFLRTRYFRRA